MAGASTDLQIEIERFLSHEARLLDEHRWREWLDLFTDDIFYRMPVRQTTERPPGAAAEEAPSFALYNDDKASLRLRVMRLETGQAHAETPPSVTQHLVTNVLIEPTETPGEYEVSSKFTVYQERRGKHGYTFFGSRRDRLRQAGGGWKIARREIALAHTILPTTISIFF